MGLGRGPSEPALPLSSPTPEVLRIQFGAGGLVPQGRREVPAPPEVPGDTTELPPHTAKGGTDPDSNLQVWPPAQGFPGHPASGPGLREAPLSPLLPLSLLRSTSPGGRLSIAMRRGLACPPPPHIPLSSVWGSAGLPSPSPPASSFTPLGWKAPCPRAAPASPGMGRAGEGGPSTRDQHFFSLKPKAMSSGPASFLRDFKIRLGVGGMAGRAGRRKSGQMTSWGI